VVPFIPVTSWIYLPPECLKCITRSSRNTAFWCSALCWPKASCKDSNT